MERVQKATVKVDLEAFIPVINACKQLVFIHRYRQETYFLIHLGSGICSFRHS